MTTKTQVYLDDKTQEAFIRAMRDMKVSVTKRKKLPHTITDGPFYRGFVAAYNSTHAKPIDLGMLGIGISDRQRYWDGYIIGEIQRGVDCMH